MPPFHLAGFPYRYQGGSNGRTLLLLHGTGGDESSLLEIGAMIDPDAAILSPRGQVQEHGMNRFFKRHAEGVFDIPDLKARTADLVRFIEEASVAHHLDRGGICAVGYSNGANIAASMLLLHPGILKRAALFRAMYPLEPVDDANLNGTAVFMASGELDPMINRDQAISLEEALRETGASVTHRWEPTGHGLTMGDVLAAQEWLAAQ